ncbi:hypothetical protein ACOKXV_16315, partial [Sporosarcina psychrophila]|uniref:hypothetical protein n=1 Tax=Sporosarcina psychrophila TaxID=1476 RepID=UPI003BA0E84A
QQTYGSVQPSAESVQRTPRSLQPIHESVQPTGKSPKKLWNCPTNPTKIEKTKHIYKCLVFSMFI